MSMTITPAAPSAEVVLDAFAAFLQAVPYAANTVAAYTRDARIFVADHGDDLRAETVRAWLERCPASPATRARRRASVLILADFLAAERLWPVSPDLADVVPLVRVVRGDSRLHGPLSLEEMTALWNATAGEARARDRALIALAAALPLRVSGLCALRVADVTRDDGGRVLICDTPLPPPAARALLAYGQIPRWSRLRVRGGFLLVRAYGRRHASGLSRGGFYNVVQAVATRAGLATPLPCERLRGAPLPDGLP